MAKITLLVIVSAFIYLNTNAQLLQWHKKYDGGGDDVITAMVADAAGNVFVTGYSVNANSNSDYVTIKYNANGVRQWIARYDGPGNGNDAANAICVDKNGNVYVTGLSDALTGAFIDNDAATIKYNAQGSQVWVARYDGGFDRTDEGRAIKADNAGNVYITGYTAERKNGGAHSDINYLTVKYNTSGRQLWASVYAGPSQDPNNQVDSANAIGLDAAGNVYVTGVSDGITSSPVNLHQDYLTLKYSSTGQELWTARYDGPGAQIDEAYALAVNNAGDVFITGVSTGAGLNGYDMATIKYNTSGSMQWVLRYDAAKESDLGFALAIDDSSNVYVTGSSVKTSNAFEDIYTVKYNTRGVQQWAARYNGGDNDDPGSIALDRQGDVYVSGYSTHAKTGEDMIVIKYNNSGVQQWKNEFRGSQNFAWDASNAVAVDSLNNVYTAGYTTNNNGDKDYAVLKYGSGSVVAENMVAEQDRANAFVLYQNAPNPFNNQTIISFKILSKTSQLSDVRLWIEDVNGKILSVLINKQLSNGDYSISWNAQHFLQGVYYCKLLCDNRTQTIKLAVAK